MSTTHSTLIHSLTTLDEEEPATTTEKPATTAATIEPQPTGHLSHHHSHDHAQLSLTKGEKLATLAVVVLPAVGTVVAMIMLWGVAFSWLYFALFMTFYIASGLGITVGFHRLFTHRSFEASKPVRWFWAVLGSMAAEGPVLQWVAMHRCHHQHSDHEEDPHSPHHHGPGIKGMLQGAWHSHVGWLFKADPANLQRYVVDFRDDSVVQNVSKQFLLWFGVGLILPAIIAGLVTMSWMGALLGLLWGGLVRVFFVHHVTWSINSVCHIWGSRPFNSHDESRNNAIMGVLAFGEGWHNNHHAFPASARHGLKWYQFDSSYLVIKAMELVGLASKVRVPDAKRIETKLKASQAAAAQAKDKPAEATSM